MDRVCPYLGVPSDKTVHYGYPNALNVCYADRSGWSDFQPIEAGHQHQFCLTADHLLCPIFMRQAAVVQRGGRKTGTQNYLEFFGLRQEPFSIVPQPQFLVESGTQQQAHAGLRWLIDHQQGLGLLFGPVGTGKTVLCHALFNELEAEPGFVPVLLLTPNHYSEYALMADLLVHWGVKPRRRRSLRDLETVAHRFLVQTVLEQQRTAVLIVDEAQTLSRRLLQQMCKLLNWQDGGRQLLQVILAGQPGLQGRVSRVPALRDRAVVKFTLSPMTAGDMQHMIAERLRRAGRRGDLFAPSALQLIHQHTGGLPRRVTILCLLSLWWAYREGKRYITGEIVQAVIEHSAGGDLFAERPGQVAQLVAGWPSARGQPLSTRLPRFFQSLWARFAT